MDTVETDCLIFGGGVAGLWLLNRLRQAGYSALLLTNGALGGHQTINSAGMIHGGLKYGLSALTRDEQLDDMPVIWQQCLQNNGEIDLSAVQHLAYEQHLWAESTSTAQAALFLTAHALSGQVDKLAKEAYPQLFNNLAFQGEVYRVAYPVVDPVSLVNVLASPYLDSIFEVPAAKIHIETDDKQNSTAVFIHQGQTQIRLRASSVFFAGGEGNADLLHKIGVTTPLMTVKPIHMLCIQHELLPAFYGHCLGMQRKQRLTITTHSAQGKNMWYVGGETAESGSERDEKRQIAIMLEELKKLLPWQSLQGARYKTLLINRIYPHERRLLGSSKAYVHFIGNNGIIWPTRLILAPNAAHQVLAHLQRTHKIPHHAQPATLPLPQPTFAQPMWEKLFA
jgi:glycine/D-amino acid oxidase-like deaminating enzyme